MRCGTGSSARATVMARTEPKRSASALVTTRENASSSFGGTASRIVRSARAAARTRRVALTTTCWHARATVGRGNERGLGIRRLRRRGLAVPRAIRRAERLRILVDIGSHRQKARRRNTQTHDPFRLEANHVIGRGNEKQEAVMGQIMQRLVDPPTRMLHRGRHLRDRQRDDVGAVLGTRRQEAQRVEEQRVRTRRLGELDLSRGRARRDGRTRKLGVGVSMERRVLAAAPDRRPGTERHRCRRRSRVLNSNGLRKSLGVHRNHPSKEDGQTTGAAEAAGPSIWLAKLAMTKPRTAARSGTVHRALQSPSEPGIGEADNHAPKRLALRTTLHRHPRLKQPPTRRKRPTRGRTGTVHRAEQGSSPLVRGKPSRRQVHTGPAPSPGPAPGPSGASPGTGKPNSS